MYVCGISMNVYVQLVCGCTCWGSEWLFIGVYVGLMCGCRHVCGVSVSVYVCVYRVSVWAYMCEGLVCGIYRCVYIGLVYGYRYVYVCCVDVVVGGYT